MAPPNLTGLSPDSPWPKCCFPTAYMEHLHQLYDPPSSWQLHWSHPAKSRPSAGPLTCPSQESSSAGYRWHLMTLLQQPYSANGRLQAPWKHTRWCPSYLTWLMVDTSIVNDGFLLMFTRCSRVRCSAKWPNGFRACGSAPASHNNFTPSASLAKQATPGAGGNRDWVWWVGSVDGS